MSEPSINVQLAAILFVATEPITAARLADVIGTPVEDVQRELDTLQATMRPSGICVSVLDGHYRLVSAPEAAETVRRFLQEESSSDLSRSALETLAIIAYRGPLTKSSIEAIRGVASETMLRNLLARGLVVSAGKSPEPGHPDLYAISHGFLQHFGLTSQTELPPVPEAVNAD